MGKHRGDKEIITDILDACRDGGLTYIKIMAKARLEYKQCLAFLHQLEGVGLIAQDCKIYFPTEKGFQWLKHEEMQTALMNNNPIMVTA